MLYVDSPWLRVGVLERLLSPVLNPDRHYWSVVRLRVKVKLFLGSLYTHDKMYMISQSRVLRPPEPRLESSLKFRVQRSSLEEGGALLNPPSEVG